LVRGAKAHEISVTNIFEKRDNLGPQRIDDPDKRPSTCWIAGYRTCVHRPARPSHEQRGPNQMPSDWYVVIDGNSCGPFDDNRIKALTREGRITPETLVSRAGMKQWVAARQIKGLFPAGQAAAQPSPAYPRQPAATTPAARPQDPPASEESPFPILTTGTRPARFRYGAKPDCTVNMMLGLGGAGALLLGFFCPILRLPIIGSMSYLGFMGLLVREGAVSEMTISGFLVIATIVIAFIAAVAKQRQLFWVPGLAGCLAAVLTIGKYFWMQGEMASKMKKDLDGNPFAGLAQAMVQAVSLDFGIGVIVIGAALIIAAAVVPPGKRT